MTQFELPKRLKDALSHLDKERKPLNLFVFIGANELGELYLHVATNEKVLKTKDTIIYSDRVPNEDIEEIDK